MIKTIQSKLTLLVAVLLVAATALPAVVSAQSSERGADKAIEVQEKVKERKEKAQLSAEEKQTIREDKKTERIQVTCERRVAKIESSMRRITGLAERHLGVIDSFYERVQSFYDSGQITISNYDDLNAAVEEAQANAIVEIAALSELTVDIDCSDPEVVVDVRAYRGSLGQAKESLKTYRKSLVSLISSMRSAAAEDKDSSSEGTEADDTNEVETESEPEEQESQSDSGESTAPEEVEQEEVN